MTKLEGICSNKSCDIIVGGIITNWVILISGLLGHTRQETCFT